MLDCFIKYLFDLLVLLRDIDFESRTIESIRYTYENCELCPLNSIGHKLRITQAEIYKPSRIMNNNLKQLNYLSESIF